MPLTAKRQSTHVQLFLRTRTLVCAYAICTDKNPSRVYLPIISVSHFHSTGPFCVNYDGCKVMEIAVIFCILSLYLSIFFFLQCSSPWGVMPTGLRANSHSPFREKSMTGAPQLAGTMATAGAPRRRTTTWTKASASVPKLVREMKHSFLICSFISTRRPVLFWDHMVR